MKNNNKETKYISYGDTFCPCYVPIKNVNTKSKVLKKTNNKKRKDS